MITKDNSEKHELKLDKIDLKILEIVQGNGRITNLLLSSEIGLSPAPTLERVKKLENSGIIKSYHASLDENALGLGIKAIVQVSLTRQINNAIHNFKQQIMGINEIVECYQVTGNFDYQLKLMVPDIHAFERLIEEKLSKIEEIRQMQTMVIVSTVKESKILPLEYENGH
jgi:Lrp/AsnC family transcriptional regulator, leucine-responsive regulatory protein